jgi:polysaccharide export outer membrane protein
MRAKGNTGLGWGAAHVLAIGWALVLAAPGSIAGDAPPAAAAAPPAYVLGPGDEISVSALGAEELAAHPLRVDPSGDIDAPLIGHVHVGGMTLDQLRTELSTKLQTQLKHPQVSIAITEFRSQPVSVMGAVNKPGVYQLQGEKSLVEVLSLAEGVRNDAGSSIRITRRVDQGELPLLGATRDPSGEFVTAEISLQEALDGRGAAGMLSIRPHDVVSVARGQTVYVVGEVKKSGGFALGERQRISVLQALSLAEGLGPLASPGGAKILRATGQDSARTEIPVDLKRMLSGKAEDIALKPDDILFVPNSTTKNVALRSLEAAVNIGTGVTIWRVGLPRP